LEIAGGYLSPDFVTDRARGEARLQDPYILIVKGRVTSMRQILGVLEAVAKTGRALLVVADDIEGEALATLVINKIRGSLRCCAARVSASQAGSDAIDDMASITGAAVVSEGDFQTLSLKDLGSATGAVVTANRTTIIGGALLN
jgi:chaperonin GroEL